MVKSNNSNTQYLKNFGSGAVESVSSDILGLLGLIQGVGNYIVKAPKLLSSDYSHEDLVQDSFVDNEILKASDKTRNWIRDNLFGIDINREQTGGEKAANILGGVGVGLVSAARSAASQGAKFSKAGIKSSADDAAKAIAKKDTSLETFLDWTTPRLSVKPNKAGNYVTKENITKIAAQSTMPFVGTEAISYATDQDGIIGDYRKTNPELQAQLDSDDPSQFEDENTFWKLAKNAAIVGAGVWGYKTLKNKFEPLSPISVPRTKTFAELETRKYLKELEANAINKNAMFDVAKMERLLTEATDDQLELLKLPTRDLILKTGPMQKFVQYAQELNSLAANPQTSQNVSDLFETWHAFNSLRSSANTAFNDFKKNGILPSKPVDAYMPNLNKYVETFDNMKSSGLVNPKTGIPYTKDELVDIINKNMKNPFIKNNIDRFGQLERNNLDEYYKNGFISHTQYEEMRNISSWIHDEKEYYIYIPEKEAKIKTMDKIKKMFEPKSSDYQEGLGQNYIRRSTEESGNVRIPDNPIEGIGKSIENTQLNLIENQRRAIMVKNMVHDAQLNAPIARKNANKYLAKMNEYDYLLRSNKLANPKELKRLRQKREYVSDMYQNWVSRAKYFEEEFKLDIVPSAKSTEGLSNKFFDGNNIFEYKIPTKYKDLVAHRPNSAGFWGTLTRKSNRLFAETTTGTLNPSFTPSAFSYSMWESIANVAPEVKQIMKEQGKEFSYFGHLFQGMKEGLIGMKNKIKEDWGNFIIKNVMVDPNDTSKVINNSMFTNFIQSPQQLERFKKRFNNFLESQVGGYSPETNYLSGRVWNDSLVSTIDPAVATPREIKTLSDKAFSYLKSSYQYVSESGIYQMMKSLVSASREAAPRALKIRAASLASSQEDTIKLLNRMAKHITDNTNQGSGRGIIGGFMENFVQNYVPFGRSMVQGTYTKMKNFGAIDNLIRYGYDIKKIANSSRKVPEKAYSILARTREGLKNSLYSDTAEMLLYYVGIPAAISYLWNNNSENNKKQYYTMTDYDKSSKIILTNMFGDGQHFSIPIDQEFGVLKNMFETILDGALNLSDDNGYDPAYSSQRMVGKAIERMLNLEMPVPVQAAFALQGLEVGINPNSLSGKNGGIIRQLGYEQQNLNGSQTVRQDGLFNREAVKLFTSTLGTLGRGLVNASEEYNVADDTKSWSNSIGEFNATMFAKDLKNRANNATTEAVNSYRDVVKKLSRILNYKEQTMFKGGMPNEAAPRPLTQEEQAFLPIAETVVPYYNKNIKHGVDQISGIYAQIRSYTSAGRDVDGRAITNINRKDYMNKKNIELAKTYASVYNDFKELELLISQQLGQEINLAKLFNN